MRAFKKEKKYDPERQRRVAAFLPLAALFVILFHLGFAIYFPAPSKISASPMVGTPAPVLTFPNAFNPEETVSNHDMTGSPYLINVFSSWCFGCKREHKTLMVLSRENNIPLFGIAYNDSTENIQKMLADKGNPYALTGLDFNGVSLIPLGLKNLPATLAVNSDGYITAVHEGILSKSIAETMIQSTKEPVKEHADEAQATP